MLKKFLGLWWVRSGALFFMRKNTEDWGGYVARVGLFAGFGAALLVGIIGRLAGFAGLIGLWDSFGGFSVAIFTVSFLMVVVGLWFSPAEEVNVPPSGAKKPAGKVRGIKPKPSKTAKPASDKVDTVDTEPTVPLLYDGLEKTVPLPANYRFDMAK
jgi:uncharacterized membrane protein YphA (DoxX/SURF4 family)